VPRLHAANSSATKKREENRLWLWEIIVRSQIQSRRQPSLKRRRRVSKGKGNSDRQSTNEKEAERGTEWINTRKKNNSDEDSQGIQQL
jgi:hypothetical protein